MQPCHIHNTPDGKVLSSPGYNFVFRRADGFFARWGRTFKEDPDYSPYGPEIADIEVSTICHGVGQPCRFCYKQNGPVGQNMSLATFQKILACLPPTVTQIAFGIGDIDANPDLWDIFQHCRDKGVVPNVTINGARMTLDHYARLAWLCGAVAVSHYEDDVCFNAVQHLVAAGLQQVNIHQIISKETYEDAERVIRAVKQDPRLQGLRAVVLLAVKPVGRGNVLTPLRDVHAYGSLVTLATSLGVGVGFDSCSAPRFLQAVQGAPEYLMYEALAEPCESTLFSIYVDVEGKAYPCSFAAERFAGLDLLAVEDFGTEVWHHESTVKWRKKLLRTCHGGLMEGCRQCPEFDIY